MHLTADPLLILTALAFLVPWARLATALRRSYYAASSWALRVRMGRRLGATVLEVVSGDVGSGLAAADAPSTWFGLALDVDDLDATAAFLGPDGLGPIKAAVQPGRRIATLRHKAFGLTVPVALMDRHGSDEPAAR